MENLGGANAGKTVCQPVTSTVTLSIEYPQFLSFSK